MQGAKPVSTPLDTSTKVIEATTDKECIDQQHNWRFVAFVS